MQSLVFKRSEYFICMAMINSWHVLTAYGFFLVVSLASMQIKSFLKSLFQNKTPDLSFKYISIQVHDLQGQH